MRRVSTGPGARPVPPPPSRPVAPEVRTGGVGSREAGTQGPAALERGAVGCLPRAAEAGVLAAPEGGAATIPDGVGPGTIGRPRWQRVR